MSYLVVIPARLKSTRLPEKVLADIAVHDPEGFGAIAEAAKAGLERAAAN